ncbi:hypothetical protein TWF481_009269 [Arthrobotrys musiformis]|uniref:BTB domain-containing protein n=1 Tax=Arthrobotrys musiformis TaxID=47236 RepID=A0AAV9W3B7_9PEZI
MHEAKTRKVNLSLEIDTRLAFERFMQWCYFGYYIYYPGNSKKNPPLLWIDAAVYVFAERILCSGLKDFALNQAQALCGTKDAATIQANLSNLPDVIEFVYKNTVDGSGLDIGSLVVSSLQDDAAGEEASKKPKDGFRSLLASASARSLDRLRLQPAFMKVHRSLPDFAADVLFFVQQSPGGHPSGQSSCIIN